ncbi:MFS transporter [Burkholderia multivorans]|uniref:MFS transporter n=1 Tax=Burkholderia multivorans TaxID=87883 RepID=UPI000CFFF18F|nr:MFS transporter [Burkholderia multivorans]MBR8241303.1 MHS family MFS transporter [Burkholderia multivorans]MDR9177590.1 Proline/betaine transporter [Burkholderia multivorans]MDR9179234.1 Proline/betaine transporter [Burkholderia multivorans]MDR9186294.1 Proline/betaine transporter [Burkholderia multivorans]MDR9191499.1 Proline/betaine transporter [Burkholderia multivorans]
MASMHTLSASTAGPEGDTTPVADMVDQKSLRRIVMASVAGNALEWYDFFLYSTAAALVFGELFFPKGTDPLIGTLGAFAGFAVGFAARPLGGVVFGHIGDRFGRKGALVWTLSIMGGATFLIGVLPTYAQVGIWAPALLLALRILQGIAAGGEWGGGVLMISESAPPEKRGFYASLSQIGVGGGFVLSAAIFFLVQMLPKVAFMSWGWRVPFLLSILIFGVGVYIRSKLPESAEFASTQAAGKKAHMPVLDVIRKHPREILLAMGLRVAENGGSYIMLAFALAYGKFIGVSSQIMLAGVIVSMSIELFAMLLWGRLSDRIGRKPVYLIGALGLVVIAFPFFWLIDTKVPALIWLAFLLGNAICHGAMIGTQPSLMGELFSTEVRYSGMALGHEVASVFAGGLAPMLATALLAHYHAAWPVALMMMGMGFITVIALAFTRETAVGRG